MIPIDSNQKQKLGCYELLGRIAVGGMAEIFLANENKTGELQRKVIIKRILPHLAKEQEFVDMFLKEAQIVSQLQHPNIVRLYTHEVVDRTHFLVMEYIEGVTIAALQRRRQGEIKLPHAVALSIILQACNAAHEAHELHDDKGIFLGLVHRDISPQNLMVDHHGCVKLLDFGIAKETAKETETGQETLKGKFAYMAPEQSRGMKLDRRSDIFSLGTILWELCTGERLFLRDSEIETIMAVGEAEIILPSSFDETLHLEIERVILKALAPKREERFQSAQEMGEALLSAANATGIPLGREVIKNFLRLLPKEILGPSPPNIERDLASNDHEEVTVNVRPQSPSTKVHETPHQTPKSTPNSAPAVQRKTKGTPSPDRPLPSPPKQPEFPRLLSGGVQISLEKEGEKEGSPSSSVLNLTLNTSSWNPLCPKIYSPSPKVCFETDEDWGKPWKREEVKRSALIILSIVLLSYFIALGWDKGLIKVTSFAPQVEAQRTLFSQEKQARTPHSKAHLPAPSKRGFFGEDQASSGSSAFETRSSRVRLKCGIWREKGARLEERWVCRCRGEQRLGV